LTSDKSIGSIESNGSDLRVSKMLSDFEDESVVGSFNFKSIKNWWKFSFELDIYDGTNDL
jgi:hypothetical protein